ncbi:hypothetical protein L6R52_29895, partial [Myxococcota bacterium]|nr:hypothetical protein [Myxococcota bacterium]
MDGREDARHAIEVSRVRLATIAEELARRASMDWVKDRAKTRAIARTKAIARPAVPWALGALAVALGAFAFVRWGGARGQKVGAA